MANETPSQLAQSVRRAFCSNCGGTRNCEIRGEYVKDYDDDAGHFWGRTVATNSEDYGSVVTIDGTHELEHFETLSYWPAISRRQAPSWIAGTGIDADQSGSLQAAMLEVYGALDNDLHMLAAIGIRTVWDVATELLGIPTHLSFENKLSELVKQDRIGGLDKDRMQVVVDAGSASAHRGWRPAPTDIKTMMDVLEHFIQTAFVGPEHTARLDAAAAKVKNTVPPRKKNASGKGPQTQQKI